MSAPMSPAAVELEEYARMVREARKAMDDAAVNFAVAIRNHERAIARLREAR